MGVCCSKNKSKSKGKKYEEPLPGTDSKQDNKSHSSNDQNNQDAANRIPNQNIIRDPIHEQNNNSNKIVIDAQKHNPDIPGQSKGNSDIKGKSAQGNNKSEISNKNQGDKITNEMKKNNPENLSNFKGNNQDLKKKDPIKNEGIDLEIKEEGKNNISEINRSLQKKNTFTENKGVDNSILNMTQNSDVDQNLRQQYDKIQVNVQPGTYLTDSNFPPQPKSLGTSPNKFADKVSSWKRIPDIYKEIVFFPPKLTPADVQQGALGDCYFLSSLGVLTSKPELLKRLFHKKDITKTGYYSVWIFDSGEVVYQVIDDHVPCYSWGDPSFSKSKNGAIWVLLLEKAYAKTFGSYENIESGTTAEALNALTGAPTIVFSKEEKSDHQKSPSKVDKRTRSDIMWDFITKNLNAGFLMCASSNTTQKKESKMESGIISTHAYGFYDAREFQNSKKQTIRAVKIRNPWGEQELLGSCKVRSDALMTDLKEKYGITADEDKGMCWIKYEDFIQNFEEVTVCKVHNNFKYKFVRSQLYKWDGWGLSLVTFEVKKSGLVYFSVHQKIRRHFQNETHQYSYVRVLLVKVNKTGEIQEFIKGKFKAAQQLVIEKNLDIGQYVAFIEIDWVLPNNKDTIDIVVSTYSRHPVKVKNYQYQNTFELYDKIIKSYIKQKSAHIETHTFSNKFENTECPHKILKHKFFKFGLFVYWYINEEKDIIFDIKLEQSAPPQNMKLFHPKLQNNSIPYLRLKGGEEQLVIIKTVPKPANQSNLFSYSTGTLTENMQFKYTLAFLKEQLLKNVTPKDWNGVKIYNMGYVGGMVYYMVNKSKGVLTVKIDTTCKNYKVDTLEMENIAPGQKFERVLTENKEYMLAYHLDMLKESSISPPALQYSLTGG